MKKLLLAMSISLVSMNSAWSAPMAEDAYVRAMPPGQKVTGAFMVLQNPDGADRALIKAESDAAETVELHEHINEDGVMKMRPVKQIDVKANSKTDLKPGGYHVMLIGLTKPLSIGDKVSIKLHFDDGSKQDIQAPVKKIDMAMKGGHKGMMGGHKMSGNMQKMKAMQHANPMPNLMMIVMKQGESLDLSDEQKAALKKWRTENNAKTQALAQKITDQDMALKAKSLEGATAEEIEKLATEVLALRMQMIKGKTKCRDNMKTILNEKQYEKLISLYKETAKKKMK